ncbi:FAD-dependent oxidoreductase, partial [Salmonella enterica subsp. enterica serovar Oranienburg]|nr:FAD-dependent oxidoreductase [Salmonella enterica subsp. enterica serovar Oranienburg]
LQFPARYLVQFMANHQMLQVSGRPQWQVVKGGSSTYVRALRQRWDVDERLSSPVRSVTRQGAQVAIDSNRGLEHFDHLV